MFIFSIGFRKKKKNTYDNILPYNNTQLEISIYSKLYFIFNIL